MTSRQERATETRARVFAAATELFTRRGYHATTVDEIASRAEVAKGTFFVHFASKGPVEALRAAVMALGEKAAVNRRLTRGVISATLESQEVGGEARALFE